MYVCMYVCMHACMHACMYIHIYIYMYTYDTFNFVKLQTTHLILVVSPVLLFHAFQNVGVLEVGLIPNSCHFKRQ